MQQSRYNIFNQIHKGLRAMLYDTALRIQQMIFHVLRKNRLFATVRQLEKVLAFFDKHADPGRG